MTMSNVKGVVLSDKSTETYFLTPQSILVSSISFFFLVHNLCFTPTTLRNVQLQQAAVFNEKAQINPLYIPSQH